MNDRYSIVQLQNGTHSVRSLADQETFHPGIGPVAEAEALYVTQLRLPQRVAASHADFMIWDVGLGAAANAITALRGIQTFVREHPGQHARQVRLISFDVTAEAAAFALEHRTELGYLDGFDDALSELIANGSTRIESDALVIQWTLHLGDFPGFLRQDSLSIQAPDAVLFDPHSPTKNPAMWTVPFFTDLFRGLDPKRPCALANYTRSTMARIALLLAGFFVGAGHASGFKEETTVAANRLDLLSEPLGARWLNRARRSHAAEPLWEPVFRQAPLSARTWEKLERHPQFHDL
jgi:tRNA U34 5-methylaminomethyl-2-thiouridine-forming methyltransferase MnmC